MNSRQTDTERGSRRVQMRFVDSGSLRILGDTMILETALTVMGGALGLLVPGLLAWALVRGAELAPLSREVKARAKTFLIAGIGFWTSVVWTASIAGWISYHPGDLIPRFVIPLMVPVIVGLIALANRTFRTILDHTPLATLVGVQAFRLAGFAFLIVANIGMLPTVFASGGVGDIATGILAILAAGLIAKRAKGSSTAFWAFNAVGLLDLLNVAFLLLMYYPIWSDAIPSSAVAADFSLVMIPAIAAPAALLLHAYSIRGYLWPARQPELQIAEAA